MIDLRNRALLFKDKRFLINNKNVYIFAKANYYNYGRDKSSPFEFFYRVFRTDEEAKQYFDLYKNDCLPNETTYNGAENFLKLIYIKPPHTISLLAHILNLGIEDYVGNLDSVISNKDILFIKNCELKLVNYDKEKDEWIFKNNKDNYYIVQKPYLLLEEIISENNNSKNKNSIINVLFIKKPIEDLILLEDSGNKTFFRYK